MANPRLHILVILLAACTRTDEERLDNLMSHAEVDCGSAHYGCYTNADRVASCMNDALTHGDRAWTTDERQDTYGYYIYTYNFIVDQHVEVWELQDGSNFSSDKPATELRSCTGPFVVEDSCFSSGFSGKRIRLSGCP